MSIDDIEAPLASQPQATPEAHWKVREHRRHVRHRQLAPEKYRNPYHLHAAVGTRSGKGGRARGKHRYLMTPRKVTGHGCHDHAAPAAQRRIFEIAEQNAHELAAIAILRIQSVYSASPREPCGDFAMNTPAAQSLNRAAAGPRALAARLEPFDSYWQAPKDVEKGFSSFTAYYKANYLAHMPQDRDARILVISCGPGYLVNMLRQCGYRNVLGIDSDPAKVEFARRRSLPCEAAQAFPFLTGRHGEYDVIIPEQELNHLTLDETIEFLRLCRDALRPGGKVVVYAMNGANPLVGSENLAHNIDHFYNLTEYSLEQVLNLSGYRNVRVFP